MQAGRRRIFAMDAYFEGAFAMQGAVFFVLPAGVVDKHQEIVAVLLIADGLALPVTADRDEGGGKGGVSEEEKCGEESLHRGSFVIFNGW